MIRLPKHSLTLRFFVAVVLIGLSAFKGSALGKGIELETSPQVINKPVFPGETSDIKIKVINRSPFSVEVVPEVSDLALDSQGCNVEISDEAYLWGLKNLITVFPGKFKLRSGEEKEVRLNIKAPESLTGGRYGTVYFSASNLYLRSEIAMVVRCGTPVFITVPGTEVYSSEIRDISFVSHSKAYKGFEVSLYNTGNLHISAQGMIKISGGKETRADIKLEGGTGTILPGGTRLYKACLLKEIPDGDYKVTIIFTFQGKTITAQKDFKVKGGQGIFK